MHDYVPKQKAFYKDGRKVSRQAVRREINGLIDYVQKQAGINARAFNAKRISAIEFELRMRELLRSAHIVAASVGRGGRARMRLSDWGRVGAKIRWQYGYLSKFARKLKSGVITESVAQSRARSYTSSVFVSFMRTFQESQTEFVEGGKNPVQCRLITHSEEGCEECAADEAEGWMSVDDMGEIGTRLCGDFCRCEIEFDDGLQAGDLEFDVKVTIEA